MAKTTRLAAQGALILSELNDLKRTIPSCAKDIGWAETDVNDVVAGNADEQLVAKFIDDCTDYYPVRRSALILPQSDCQNGVKFFPLTDSIASARVFNRPNAKGDKTPYYEYRDTAASKLSDYRPEWIEQLRVVDDNDPNNPDVIFNNGHFMHQVTFFVGPVNFYYEIDGVKYCEEMETGGSNYITPFYPHSFASRDKDQQAYIVAVTFGGHAKRALGDLMTLGAERSRKFLIDRSSASLATQDLLDFHLGNMKLNRATLQKRLNDGGYSIDVMDKSVTFSKDDLETLAGTLGLRFADLLVEESPDSESVVVKQTLDNEAYHYPSAEEKRYKIWPLAAHNQSPGVSPFRLKILSGESEFTDDFCAGTHTYVFNYGETPCTLNWRYEGAIHSQILEKGDSIYLQPHIEHQFRINGDDSAEIVSVGIPGAITQEVQLELSNMDDFDRVIQESKRWF